MSATPAAMRKVIVSCRTSAASTIVNGRLSLSTGATRDAGPSYSARKYASHEHPVASPDKTRKSNARRFVPIKTRCSPAAIATAQANGRITAVRIAVASEDGTPSTPIFARMAVSAAKRCRKQGIDQPGHVISFEAGQIRNPGRMQ